MQPARGEEHFTRHSAFYDDVAESPELAVFLRYISIWAWTLDNLSSDIKRLRTECDASLVKHGLSVTDLHPRDVEDVDPELSRKMYALQDLVTETYSKKLCRFHAVMQMPEQSEVYREHLAAYHQLFKAGRYVPTGESETFYKDGHSDACAVRGIEDQDALTDSFIKNIKGLKARTRSLVFWKSKPDESKPVDDVEQNSPRISENMHLHKIRQVVNLLTVIYAPLLYTLSMFALSSIGSFRIQIAVLGLLGLLLTTSLQLLVEKVQRAGIFMAIGSYFAVLSIFMGATNGGSVGNLRC